ncbi:MAG: PEFG-CTERM sorting domain-containing protein [Nitrosopumilaceae archaeon]|nr:PEFG-CTERM sorting domain-containing protein [Nitrosopumilaceae archaeon]
MKVQLLITSVFFLMLIPVSNAYAEHVLINEAYGQFLDISQLEAEKETFEFDDVTYTLYYGYHGSLDSSMTESFEEPVVTEMIINQDNKSIEVTFEEVPDATDFWVRIPFEVLTAEKEQYQVLVNGEDTGYDLMKMPDAYVVGLIITEETEHVEIIGTQVIPEFGTIAILVLGVSIVGIIYATRRSSFTTGWTRIN